MKTRKWSWILGFHAQNWARIPFILGGYLGAKYGNWRKHDDDERKWQLLSLDFHADRALKLKQIYQCYTLLI